MKASFEYDHDAARALCREYSDNPATLDTLMDRLEIEVGPHTPVPSPWNPGMQALHMLVTLNGYRFPYYGSHIDAQAIAAQLNRMGRTRTEERQMQAILNARKQFRDGLLYSILAGVKSDYSLPDMDPEDVGLDPDSVADMARWNEAKEHARKLRAALKLTPEELDSLPS